VQLPSRATNNSVQSVETIIAGAAVEDQEEHDQVYQHGSVPKIDGVFII
jgi:hypothetical protein